MQQLCVLGLIALLLALGSACGGGDGSGRDDEGVCTLEARASVVVAVVNPTGAPLPGTTITYRVDGGEAQAAVCADPSVLLEACTVFVAGFEVAGNFTIQGQKAGFNLALASVRVEQDETGCHVLTQELTLPLTPL